MIALAQQPLFEEPPPRPGWRWTHRWRLRLLPIRNWADRSGARMGQRVKVVARGFSGGPHNLLVEFEDGQRVVATRASCSPVCCKSTMVFLCAFLGARAYWCPRCDRVVDILECPGSGTGHEHVNDHGEFAPGKCATCGWWRTSLHPNGAGEKAMRQMALAEAKGAIEKAKEGRR